MTTVYVYVMDTFADWELGYAMAELKSGRFFRKDAPAVEVKTVGVTKDAIQSMGGLTIVPDCTVDEMMVKSSNMLLLPGANTWGEEKHAPIVEKAKEFLDADAAVAAICGATVALAGARILDKRVHTSNGIGFLDMMCPGYKGQTYYKDAPAATDGKLITAGSTGGLQMAKEILTYLQVFREDTLAFWFEYFSTGSGEAFFAMMQSLGM